MHDIELIAYGYMGRRVVTVCRIHCDKQPEYVVGPDGNLYQLDYGRTYTLKMETIPKLGEESVLHVTKS